jgi:putative flippase GtrA
MHHETTWKTARQATLHCLTGCGIGEVLGMVLGAAFNWGNTTTVVISIVLAFFFGYSLTLRPLFKAKMTMQRALQTAFASDTLSITTMEVVDNLIIIVVPGALAASLSTFLFWWTLALSLAIAFIVTVPVNYWLIKRGKGHALIHEHHHHDT